MAVGSFAVIVVIVLVVFFPGPKWSGGGEFGFDVMSLLLEAFDQSGGYCLLILVQVENTRAILRTNIGALTVSLREVVGFKKEGGEFFVADLVGIEGDFDGFGMSGFSGAYLLVGGVGDVASGVADGGGDDSRGALEVVFGSPETARGEYCSFGFGVIGGDKIHGDRVDAVTCVLWGVAFAGEDMAQMAGAIGAEYFSAATISIGDLVYCTGDLIVKTGPAAVGFELGSVLEQFCAALFAGVKALFEVIIVLSREGRFRSLVDDDILFPGC